MKFNYLLFALVSGLCMACSGDDPIVPEGGNGEDEPVLGEGTMFADFETYNNTPYYFRYGNEENPEYMPRWKYSHNVVNNSFTNSDNSSAKVLEYTSMEVKNFGLKFRFPEAKKVDTFKGIRFQIYQPANVIGKTTYQGKSKATTQQICVKLLARLNSVNDVRQEEGILLEKSKVSFDQEGKWMTFTFTFSNKMYTTASTVLKNGIAGFVILPTYGSGTTLAEENVYKCYIDNIEIF